MTARIVLDMDDVIYDKAAAARYLLRTHRGIELPGQGGVFLGPNIVAQDDLDWLWDTGAQLGLYVYGQAMPGAIDGIRHLAELGEVVVVTHRPLSAAEDTLAWLDYHRLPLHDVVFVPRVAAKSEAKPHGTVYVEDHPGVVRELLTNTAAQVVCFRQPWNTALAAQDVPRAFHWCEDWTTLPALVRAIVQGGLRA